MRIGIYGAGASGGHLAVRLALAGHAVSVIARGEHLAAIQHQGLALQQGDRILHARVVASDRPQELPTQDLLIVTVKATGLAAVSQAIAPLVGPQTQVVFAQNGMPWWYPLGLPEGGPPLPALPNFGLASAFLAAMQPAQVLGGVLYTANEVVAPGVVRNNSPRHNALEIGPALPGEGGDLPALRATLAEAGIASPEVDDIRSVAWAKLVGNACSSSIAVITGNPRAIAEPGPLQQVFLRAIDEAFAVARAHGHAVEGRLDLSRWTTHRSQHKPSLLQDFELGRPMEIAEMIEAPAAFGRSAGVACPTLDALAALAAQRAIDRGLYRRA
jgi:2-dehydropantoate 2-reductase